MNQKPKHTEPTTSSYDAVAYGYEYSYDGFGGSVWVSHGVFLKHTVSEHRGSLWITDADGNACTERSRSVNQHLQPACRRGRYLPFGEQFIDQRTNHDIRYKFTTKEEDSETGYQYFGARYYASDLSIWLSVDPLAFRYSSNSPFMYCLGNPVIYTDPDGRWVKGAGFWNNITKSDNRINAENRVAELGGDAKAYKDENSKGWRVSYSSKESIPDDLEIKGSTLSSITVESFDKKANSVRKKANMYPNYISRGIRFNFARQNATYISDESMKASLWEQGHSSNTGAIAGFFIGTAVSIAGEALGVSVTPAGIIIAAVGTGATIEINRIQNEFHEVLLQYFGSDLKCNNGNGKGLFIISSSMVAGGNMIVSEKYYNASNGELLGTVRYRTP